MQQNKLVSIALATYNGEKFLTEQLDSIYAQTYKNIEVIVTDDCSIDNTVDILKKYKEKYGLKYFVNDQNLGFVKNFEKAISLCEGEYIALSDQDDIWEKEKLEILLNEIGTNLLIHGDCSIIDEQGKTISPLWKEKSGYWINVENLLFGNVVTGCTILLKKELLKIALPFPNGIGYHDWWLAVCAANVEKIQYTPKCLIQYRQHSSQVTGAGMKKNTSTIKLAYSNIKNRCSNIDINRVIGARKQQKNLHALKDNTKCIIRDKTILNEAMIYFGDYINNKVHFKTFYIGMKYNKIVYPNKNYMYLKNIIWDIIG